MSEYLDAISRLEAPERPPMVRYIQKIPFMDYPEHDSEKDWNRIMAQGRNSRLPKYSISQRFYINEEDLNQYVYNFDLDKTFTTATGDRKSIAVREICFRNDLMKTVNFTCFALIDNGQTFLVGNEKVTTTETLIGYAEEYNQQEFEIDSDITLLKTLGCILRESLINLFGKKLKLGENIVTSFVVDVQNYTITAEVNNIRQGTTEVKAPFKFYFRCDDNDEDDYVFSGSSIYDMDRYIYPSCIDDDLNMRCSLIYDFSKHIRHFKKFASVCSTINPYSIQNIIGNPEEYHDMLNKIYPYDRQNSFQLWFNDVEGNRILNKNITGYLDLELIVDNSNNINLDV